MRVITGTAKSCRLKTLSGEDTRPTVERVKEGIFSAIAFDIEGRRVLDLFAGSGQLGIEALSRGAVSCTFVDQNKDAVAVVRDNLRAARLEHAAQVFCSEALAALSRLPDNGFDLVFLDPPYAADLLLPCLTALEKKVLPGGIVLCESDRDTVLPETVASFVLHRTYRYGRVTVRSYRCERGIPV